MEARIMKRKSLLVSYTFHLQIVVINVFEVRIERCHGVNDVAVQIRSDLQFH